MVGGWIRTSLVGSNKYFLSTPGKRQPRKNCASFSGSETCPEKLVFAISMTDHPFDGHLSVVRDAPIRELIQTQ